MTAFDPKSITRPDESYWTYGVICSAMTLIGFPFAMVAFAIKYNTLRYAIDSEGVAMRVGWLWKRETYIAYRRIQDIHVTRNLLHRWLGLSRIEIMTASGHAGAELVIEGVREFEPLRDYLYTKMRGARGETPNSATTGAAAGTSGGSHVDGGGAEALALLLQIRDEVRSLREARGAGDRR